MTNISTSATLQLSIFVTNYLKFPVNTSKGIKNLYKLKLISFKKTKHGNDVFLNISKKKEIEEIISKKLDSLYSL